MLYNGASPHLETFYSLHKNKNILSYTNNSSFQSSNSISNFSIKGCHQGGSCVQFSIPFFRLGTSFRQHLRGYISKFMSRMCTNKPQNQFLLSAKQETTYRGNTHYFMEEGSFFKWSKNSPRTFRICLGVCYSHRGHQKLKKEPQ